MPVDDFLDESVFNKSGFICAGVCTQVDECLQALVRVHVFVSLQIFVYVSEHSK